MSLGTLQLNKIIASNNSILFETNIGILVADTELSNVINPNAISNAKYNKWNFTDISRDTMVGNLYPLSSFKAQSYQYKKESVDRQNNIEDFVNVYGPDEMFVKGCQYFDYGYSLSDLTTKSITYDTYVFSDNILEAPILTTAELPTNTFIYPAKSIIETDTTSGKTTFMPLYNLSGVSFNYVEELPLDFSYYGYDNTASLSAYNYLYADTFNTKNQYDNNYSVSAVVTSTTDNNNVSAYLTNARIYNNIGSNADVLYLVYKNNRYYDTASVDISSTGVVFGMTPTSSFASTGNIAELPISSSTILSTDVIHKYDNVETIASINRIKNSDGHKSNLFSINIQNSNIDSSSLSATVKADIKKTLNNLIEGVIKNIVPANTQLFNIYWNGQ